MTSKIAKAKGSIEDTSFSHGELVELSLEETVEALVKATVLVSKDEFLFDWQKEVAGGIYTSLLKGDAEDIIVQSARQAGKTEIIAVVAVAAMLFFPKLAEFDSRFKKWEDGFWVGMYAPVSVQVRTLWERVKSRMEGTGAEAVFSDSDFDDLQYVGNVQVIKDGKPSSFASAFSAHTTCKLESKTWHLVLIDEAQNMPDHQILKAIQPMVGYTQGSIVKLGVPGKLFCDFYVSEMRQTRKGKYCYKYNWRKIAKEYPGYKKFIETERARLGEDSDEFMMNYELVWLLDRDMFASPTTIERLIDTRKKLTHEASSGIQVVGIDVGKKVSSTVVTVLGVEGEEDQLKKTILDWLEIKNLNYEHQYRVIMNFLSSYRGLDCIAIDTTSTGQPIADRLWEDLPHIEILEVSFVPKKQNEMFVLLKREMDARRIVIPGHFSVKRTAKYKEFLLQMVGAKMAFRGSFMVLLPSELSKLTDYPDSLALAVWAAEVTLGLPAMVYLETESVQRPPREKWWR